MTSSPTAQATVSCIKLDVPDNQTRYHYMLKFEHGIEKPSKEKTF
jgi:hypothetical protein